MISFRVALFTLAVCVAFLVVPLHSTIAADLELPKKDAAFVLNALQQPLVDEWIAVTASSQFDDPREQAALLMMRNGIQKYELDFFFQEAPKESVKIALKLAGFLVKLRANPAAALSEMEKTTVQRAIETGKDWLLQHEVRVAKGRLDYVFEAYDGSNQEPNFAHVTDFRAGEVITGFYSPEPVVPPTPQGKMIIGLGGTPWDFASWHKAGNTHIPPFIIRISGDVEQLSLGGYKWRKTKHIEVVFDEPVPDLVRKTGFRIPFISSSIDSVERSIKEWLRVVEKIVDAISPGDGSVVKRVTDGAIQLVDTITELLDRFDLGGQAGIASKLEQAEKQAEELAMDEAGKEEYTPIEAVNEEPVVNDVSTEDTTHQEPLDAERLAAMHKQLLGIAITLDHLTARIAHIKATRVASMGEVLGATTTSEEVAIEDVAPIVESDNTEEEEEIIEISESSLKETLDIAPCQNHGLPGPGRSIVINEVNWMGSPDSSSDEWVELRNVAPTALSLEGWQLMNSSGSLQIGFGDIMLESNELLLLERTDDDSAIRSPADIIYTGALKNSDEILSLFNATCQVVDQVRAVPDWPAGDTIAKRAMERRSDFSWHVSREIGGTPGAPNSFGIPSFVTSGGSASVDESDEVVRCGQDGLLPPTHAPVIISEVAWMGSSVSHTKEWFELQNISSDTVSMEGWRILDAKEQIDIVLTADHIIEPDTHFLFERTDDATIPHVASDTTYTGGLSDTEESLRLFDAACELIDEVVASPDWPAGDKSERRSMERGSTLHWHTYVGSGENDIFGTPRAANSVAMPSDVLNALPERVEENARLVKDFSPYLVNTGVTVAEGATLTVEPGVVIKFFPESLGMDIFGSLVIEGTAEENVIITSSLDDTAGGVTRRPEDYTAEGDPVPAVPGSWKWLAIRGAGGIATISHATLRYGGHKHLLNSRPVVYVDGGVLTAIRTTFDANQGAVWFRNGGTGSIAESAIRNTSALVPVSVEGGAAEVSSTTFEANDYFFALLINNNASPLITGNAFMNNSGEAISIQEGSTPVTIGNTGHGNGENSIMINQGGPVWDVGMELILNSNPGLPYVVPPNYSFGDASVRVLPNAIIKAENTIRFEGSVSVEGVLGESVIFTSLEDDTHGGDTKSDGDTGPGSWDGLIFGSQSIVNMSHVEIWHTGLGITLEPGAIATQNAVVLLP